MNGRFVILLYHGVSGRTHRGIENYSRKHVAADAFARQMEHLASWYSPLPLDELLERRESGDVPPRAVAVTFDDGFENNHGVALPILERHEVPATFYLATGFIDTKRVFWVDKLEYLVNEWRGDSLHVPRLDRTFSLRSAEDRIAAVRDVKRTLKARPRLIDPVLDALEAAFGAAAYDYPDYRTLSWDQVREMAASGLCAFGAHTVDHVVLAHAPPREKERQVRDSLRAVSKELGQPVRLFSYPEGGADQYDEETIEIVRAAGCTSSPSAIFGVNDASTSPFHLRRNMVDFTAPFRECLAPLDPS